MMKKSITIIGGGLSGLSAGCYAQMAGMNAHIIDSHDYVGGFCTSWQRGYYNVNGCIHWMWGFNSQSPNYKVWQSLGVLDQLKFIKFDAFREIIYPDTRKFVVKANLNELQQDLLTLAPEVDKPFTETLIEDLKSLSTMYEFTSMDQPPKEMIEKMQYFRKYSKKMKETMAENVINPEYRKLLTLCFDVHGIAGIYGLLHIAHTGTGDLGYPVGGSKEVPKAILNKYKSLGGSIQLNTKVKNIVIENGQAKGVLLDDGTLIKSDYVLSTANIGSNIHSLVGKQWISKDEMAFYNDNEKQPGIMQVVIGYKGSTKVRPMPSHSCYLLNENYMLDKKQLNALPIKFNYDHTLCPEGKSMLLILFPADWNHWLQLNGKTEAYLDEKIKVKHIVLDQLEKIMPGFKQLVEMVDIATPLTYAKKALSCDDSSLGYYLTEKNYNNIFEPMSYKWASVKNLYRAGLNVYSPCAVTTSTMTGRAAIKQLCKDNGMLFPIGN